jgi:nitrogen-specific signal transduction histidine kinase
MTARTSTRKVAAKTKAPTRQAGKSSRPTRSKAVQPAKIPASQAAKRIAEWVQGSFLTAALGPRQDSAFEISCAQIVQRAVGAAAVVLTLQSDGSYRHFGTSEAARSMAADHSVNDPLARCLSSGAEYQVAISGKRKLTKLHDAAAASHGWNHYLCIPLYSPVGDIIGATSIYFAGKVTLRTKVVAFDKNVRTALALALAAHAAAPPVTIETHQFNSLAAAIPGVVYQRIVQPDGDIRYTYLSEGARELFGVDPEAVLKDPEVLFSTYSEDYKKTFRKRLIEASQTLTKWDVEASVNMPDGRRKTTHAVARPERRADNSVLWTGVILDASRAKEAEDSLKEANRLVGLANHAKSAFLAKMSHEMRTPLNGVLGMGDLLLKTELTQRQMRLASTLCDSAKGLLGIINDVLDLSRIEAGHFKLDLQDFNLRHCIEDAVELCATSGYRKGLEVNLIIAPDIPVGVKSDPVRIRQVLINLIGNAVKFTETGEVTIRCRKPRKRRF